MNAGTVLGTNVGYNTLSVGFKIMELLSTNFVNHIALHQGEYGTRSVLFPCQQQMGAAGDGGGGGGLSFSPQSTLRDRTHLNPATLV